MRGFRRHARRLRARVHRTDRAATCAYHIRPFGRSLIEVYFAGSLARDLEAKGEAAFVDFATGELKAAILGALPMLLGTGTGSELRSPLGLAIIGGLALSQLLTLFTSPVIYLAFDRLARRFSGRSQGERPAESTA